MGKTTKLTKEIIIKRFNEIHNNFYDYSLFDNYINNRQKIKIICPIHGEFEQCVKSHILGRGCQKCGVLKNTKNKNVFIEQSNNIHNNFYDYSQMGDYINSYTKIKIICPKHGEFNQTPHSHLKGYGCSKCSGLYKKSKNDFISECNIIYNNYFDYSQMGDYINSYTKIKIICPKHGVFKQKPSEHLKGIGCKRCNYNKVYTTKDFIIKSNIIHNNYYDYTLTNYINTNTKVKIICKKHGIFEQKPFLHLLGKGCILCNRSKGEIKIKLLLDKHNIIYDIEKTFNDCRNKNKLRFDFYLPKYNLLIEYDGFHHFNEIDGFGGKEKLLYTQKLDKIKNEYCLNNNIRLIRIKYDEDIEEKLKSILPL